MQIDLHDKRVPVTGGNYYVAAAAALGRIGQTDYPGFMRGG